MTRRAFLATAAVALVLVPLAIEVAGWDVVVTNLGAALLVMLVVLVVIELIATRRQPTSQPGQGLFVNRAFFLTALGITSLFANIATITGFSVTAVADELRASDRPSPPAATAPAAPKPTSSSVTTTSAERQLPVRFESPRRLKEGRPKAKRFLNVRGTGTVPEGKHLWLFVYTPDEQFYYPAGAATVGPDFWYANGITLGGDARQYPEDVDALYTIYVVLVGGSTHEELTKRMKENDDIVQLTKLPAGGKTADFVTILRIE